MVNKWRPKLIRPLDIKSVEMPLDVYWILNLPAVVLRGFDLLACRQHNSRRSPDSTDECMCFKYTPPGRVLNIFASKVQSPLHFVLLDLRHTHRFANVRSGSCWIASFCGWQIGQAVCWICTCWLFVEFLGSFFHVSCQTQFGMPLGVYRQDANHCSENSICCCLMARQTAFHWPSFANIVQAHPKIPSHTTHFHSICVLSNVMHRILLLMVRAQVLRRSPRISTNINETR